MRAYHNPFGPVSSEEIYYRKEPIWEEISSYYADVHKKAHELLDIYDHSDTDEPEKFAEKLDSIIDDLIDIRDALRDKQYELNSAEL